MDIWELLTTIESVCSRLNTFVKKSREEFEDARKNGSHTNEFQTPVIFGNLDKSVFHNMDETLKVMIGVTTRVINKLDDHSWNKVVACMMQNPVLEPIKEYHTSKDNEVFLNSQRNAFKLHSSPDPDVVTKVKKWFRGLIQDNDILKDAQDEDILKDIAVLEDMAKIVAQTGTSVTSLKSLLFNVSYEMGENLDVGFLRYPDIESPYFTLHRIGLTAWSKCAGVLRLQSYGNGTAADIDCIKFKPRADIISGLNEETKALAIAEVDALFA